MSDKFQIPVFQPNWEKFQDFNSYICEIENTVSPKTLAIAKIIPPKEWQGPDPDNYKLDHINNVIIKAPLQQHFTGKNGIYELFNTQCEKSMTVREWSEQEIKKTSRDLTSMNIKELESAYFGTISKSSPIYGADCHTSLMGSTVKQWNLNNLKTSLDDTIEHTGVKIKGIHTPFLYFGSWRTTFGFHTEDMDLYSLNYNHFGAPKYWISIKPDQGHKLERLFQDLFPSRYQECSAYHRHKSIILSPTILEQNNIEFDRILQHAGEFMVTFPYGYHGGFNCGINCAEAINFMVSPPRWLEYAKRASSCECQQPKLNLFSLSPYIQRWQPQRFRAWMQGSDFGPHPQQPTKFSNALQPSLHDILVNRNVLPSTIPISHNLGEDHMPLENVTPFKDPRVNK